MNIKVVKKNSLLEFLIDIFSAKSSFSYDVENPIENPCALEDNNLPGSWQTGADYILESNPQPVCVISILTYSELF